MTLVHLKRSFSAAVLLTAAAACGSEMPRFPAEPGPTAFQPAFTQVSNVRGGRSVSNRVKYRDQGMKPGRVPGSIEVLALRGGDGMTTIAVTTGTFDEGPSLARLDKIQLRLPNAPVRNEKPQSRTWSRTVPGLSLNDEVGITAHVRYASGPGTFVVSTSTRVGRRPDLAVTGVMGPPRVSVNMPATFVATVTERNGSIGARANCLLTVNDIPVDQASRIWVDAGDVVSCEFTYIFRNAGQQDVKVALTGIDPVDDDHTNNAASTSINVVMPIPIAEGTVTASDATFTNTFEFNRGGDYPITGSTTQTQNSSQVRFDGRNVGVANDVQQVFSRLSVDGRELTSGTLVPIIRYEFDDGMGLVTCSRYSARAEWMESCIRRSTNGTVETQFQYSLMSGSVRYFGQTVFCRTNGCETYEPNDNFPTGSGIPFGVEAASTLRLEMTFTDAEGIDNFIDRIMTFEDLSSPLTTTSYCYPEFDGLGDVCVTETAQSWVYQGRVDWSTPLP